MLHYASASSVIGDGCFELCVLYCLPYQVPIHNPTAPNSKLQLCFMNEINLVSIHQNPPHPDICVSTTYNPAQWRNAAVQLFKDSFVIICYFSAINKFQTVNAALRQRIVRYGQP